MQKISLPSLRISELIENPRPSTHKRRLFSRFALGITGIQDATGITASFRPKTPDGLGNPRATPAARVPDCQASLRQRVIEFDCQPVFGYRITRRRNRRRSSEFPFTIIIAARVECPGCLAQ